MQQRRTEYKKSLPFRAWFYFRQGWVTYFAFIFAAVNTMVVTYYLAIDKIPSLLVIFPSFTEYILIVTITGIPILVLVGYVHFRRSRAYGSEQDVIVSSNPYFYKLTPGHYQKVFAPLHLMTSTIILKMATNEKVTKEDIEKLKKIMDVLDYLINGGTVGKDGVKI